jgi:hypothetical protein
MFDIKQRVIKKKNHSSTDIAEDKNDKAGDIFIYYICLLI